MFLWLGILFIYSYAYSVSNPHSQDYNVDPSKVIIVVSRGASGSTELCGIVRNIARGNASRAPGSLTEILGSNEGEMAKQADPLRTVLAYLSREQAKHPGVSVGFKFKNYHFDEKYEKLFNWMSSERIKVIYNTRNPLDEYLGYLKARQPGGRHNCGGKECARQQQKKKFAIPIDHLIPELEEKTQANAEWFARLKAFNISFIHVTYEQANTGTMEQRQAYVQKIADFFNPGFKVTTDVFDVGTVYMGHEHQSEFVKNYEEVKNKLNGTRFEHLLH